MFPGRAEELQCDKRAEMGGLEGSSLHRTPSGAVSSNEVFERWEMGKGNSKKKQETNEPFVPT